MGYLYNPSDFATDIGKYVRELEEEITTNETFKTTCIRKVFIIEDIAFQEEPEEILRKCFQKCINAIIKKSCEAEMEAEKIGVCVSSLLFSSNIYVSFRQITENTIDEVMNAFLHVLHSREEGPAIFAEPFKIRVTGIQVSNLTTTTTR